MLALEELAGDVVSRSFLEGPGPRLWYCPPGTPAESNWQKDTVFGIQKGKRKDYAVRRDSREAHGCPKLPFGLSQCRKGGRGGGEGGGVFGIRFGIRQQSSLF